VAAGQTRAKGTVERVIEGTATGIGNAVGFAAESGILFVVFGALWLAIGIGLIVSQGSVDAAWQTIRDLPLVVQAGVWVLFLPVMAGLWVWETSWPVVVRLTLLIGVAGWNLLIFLPRALTARP